MRFASSANTADQSSERPNDSESFSVPVESAPVEQAVSGQQSGPSLQHEQADAQTSSVRSGMGFRPAPFKPALLSTLRSGYSVPALLRDLGAGLTVGIVALPLAMAFAIASGTTPERGLFTAIVAGAIISMFGGSRFQIGGPTGAFVVIVAGVIARHGYEGLVVATLMAGVMLMIMGALGLGKLLRYIPYPVTTGFTSGIALLILTAQLKDLLGLSLDSVPPDFVGKIAVCFDALPTASHAALGTTGITLLAMWLVRRFIPRVPAHIVGVCVATVTAWALGLNVETIGTRFGGIPAELPSFAMPSNLLGLMQTMLPDAITIALLAAIESLLSAVVADGMTGERHHAATELMAQGMANIASSLFGGIPATGAIARTATNIRAGAFSPLAGVLHAIVLAGFIKLFAPLASMIPLASLAGVLAFVAWDMSEAHKFIALLRAPKSDVLVMLATFFLTVLVDLTVAVQVGVVLAALLFMRRMSDITGIRLHGRSQQEHMPSSLLPPIKGFQGIEVYEINGPFFFGMADRFIDTLRFMRTPPEIVILRMRHVPSIDATGVHALEMVADRIQSEGTELILSGVNDNVWHTLRQMGFTAHLKESNICPSFRTAHQRAKQLRSTSAASSGPVRHAPVTV